MSAGSAFKHAVFSEWYRENEKFLKPPICNKLFAGGQLKVMFVGGKQANDRGDYHVEDGEEFFYMIKGDMVLRVLEKGKHRDIVIKEGESFLLPARIPHSPQRPPNSLGLVIERERKDEETDALQWFVKGTTDVLWRRTFRCYDLGKDLVPVVKAFQASTEAKTGQKTPKEQWPRQGPPPIMPLPRPLDTTTSLPDPTVLDTWVQANAAALKTRFVELFKGEDFNVQIGCGAHTIGPISHTSEAFYFLLKGKGELAEEGGGGSESKKQQLSLVQGSMVVVDAMAKHLLTLSQDSVLIALTWPSAPCHEPRVDAPLPYSAI